MFINEITSSGALPTLEAAIRFAGRRQTLIGSAIANIDTPDYQPRDVDPVRFQTKLGEAIDQRRRRTGGGHGALRIDRDEQFEFHPGGRLELKPDAPSGNILYHDRNDRDLERLMQSLAENAAAFRAATELMRARIGVINAAISERP